jgi:serine/threonine-protein kinase
MIGPVSSADRIGSVVAGCRIEAFLGRGGMSDVYLAEHERLGRKVALKLLLPALSAEPEFRIRFESESRSAAEIDHRNIVPIYDAGEADGVLYMAMRYVDGGDLRGQIARGPLGVGRTLFILEQAAAGLDAAHRHGIVHRDVKPANILIESRSERVFVTDFGVARHTATPGVTRAGFFVGTVDYAAPEQIEGRPVDARTDIYALGCVLYEALSGRAPFGGDGEVAVLHAHLAEPPPTLTAMRPDLPKAFDDVVASAMAKARGERFPSCRELVRAARAAALLQPT